MKNLKFTVLALAAVLTIGSAFTKKLSNPFWFDSTTQLYTGENQSEAAEIAAHPSLNLSTTASANPYVDGYTSISGNSPAGTYIETLYKH